MALTAENVVVAGTGHVYVAPEGTAAPADLAVLPAAWVELGYVGEDGVTFTIGRETEDVNAWQATEPVRRLLTAEPKTIAFELMEFATVEAVQFALRGGDIAPGTGIGTFTPPAAGASDVRALVIDAIDGDATFRYFFERVEVSGDVEWQLTKSDATRLPLELTVLAGGWGIISDHAAWAAATLAGTADELIAGMADASDAQLEALAADKRKTVAAAAKDERGRRRTAAAA